MPSLCPHRSWLYHYVIVPKWKYYFTNVPIKIYQHRHNRCLTIFLALYLIGCEWLLFIIYNPWTNRMNSISSVHRIVYVPANKNSGSSVVWVLYSHGHHYHRFILHTTDEYRLISRSALSIICDRNKNKNNNGSSIKATLYTMAICYVVGVSYHKHSA